MPFDLVPQQRRNAAFTPRRIGQGMDNFPQSLENRTTNATLVIA
jgi:hypothetical protein